MKYLYHPTEGKRLFPDDAEPDGWFDSPARFGVITCPSQEQIAEMAKAIHPTAEGAKRIAESMAAHMPPIELADLSKEELLAIAEQRGIEVDKRLGVEKLRAVLNGDGP